MRTIPLVCISLSLGILAGCSNVMSAQSTPHDTLNIVYQCDNGLPLRVSFDRTAEIAIVNELVSLSPAPSGSGFRYTGDQHELQGKGNEIMWTAGRATPLRCVAVNPANVST